MRHDHAQGYAQPRLQPVAAIKNIRVLLLALVIPVALAACGDSTALNDKLATDKADDRSLDLSGADQPADLPTGDEAAMAAVGITRIVDATAEVSEALADAVGDLFPDEDNPCPKGGSASSDLSGSLNHPRIRMEFHECVRGDITLDGIATIRCNDLDGTDCKKGEVTLGDGESVLLFRNSAAGRERNILMRGGANVFNDEGAQRVHVVANLQGESRAVTENGPRYSFITEALTVDLHDLADDQTEVWIDGVVGIGGGAAGANCISGRFDTATPAEPLILQDKLIRSGRLQLHSPPPRPGTQRAEVAYAEGGASVMGADGVQRVYTAQQLAGLCSVLPQSS